MANKKIIPVTENDIITSNFSLIPQDAQIKSRTWEDSFRESISPLIRGGLVNAGRVAGGMVAAPSGPVGIAAGALGGGTAVDLAYQNLQRSFPRALGAPPEDIKSSLIDAGFNTVLDAGGSGLINKFAPAASKTILAAKEALQERMPGLSPPSTQYRDRLKYEVLNKFFPQKPGFVAQEALAADPNFPNLTVGQATGSEFADIITNIFTPQSKLQQIYGEQKDYLSTEAKQLGSKVGGKLFEHPTARFDAARVGSQTAKAAYKTAEKVEDELYDIAEKQLIPQNKLNAYRVVQGKPATLYDANGRPITTPGKPTLEPIIVEGPVYPTKTNSYANTVIKDIDEFMTDPTNELGRDPDVLSSLKQIKDRLVTFRNVAVTEDGKTVISYKTAKNTKLALADLFEKAPDGVKKRFSETIYTLRNLLSGDIKDSSKSWNQEARAALLKAHRQTQSNIQKFESKIGKKLVNRFNDPDIIQEDILKQATSSRAEAAQYISAVGGRREIGTHFLKDVLDRSYDVEGNFSAERALEHLAEKDEISRTVLSSDQRSQLTNLLRKMQLVPSHSTATAKVAVNIRRAGATIGLAGAAVASLANNDLRQGVYTYGTLLLTFGLTKPVVQKLMLNPQNARMLSRLVTLPPESTVAQGLLKNLMKGPLKGVQFEMQYANGEPAGTGEIKSDGKIHPVK